MSKSVLDRRRPNSPWSKVSQLALTSYLCIERRRAYTAPPRPIEDEIR